MSRARIKRVAARGAPEGLRLSSRRVGMALVYHRVAERAGDSSHELVPAVARAAFESQLRFLLRHYSVVLASDLMPAIAARKRGQRIPVAVTFDDDLPEHVEVVRPILTAAGAPATFFVCGSSLDQPFFHWWESLQLAVDRDLLTPGHLRTLPEEHVRAARTRVPGAIHELAGEIERMRPDERLRLTADLSKLVGGHQGGARLSAADVQALAADGFEIGFHTRRHDVLVGLPADVVEQRLTEGRERLEVLARRPLSAVAYPHGKADEGVAAAAANAGFRAGFTGLKEAATASTNPLLVGRLEPRPTDSARALGEKIAWVLLHALRRDAAR